LQVNGSAALLNVIAITVASLLRNCDEEAIWLTIIGTEVTETCYTTLEEYVVTKITVKHST
jgi:hypothetical protein